MVDYAMASLAGLNEGLRVRHIAASPLLTCCAVDDLSEVLSRPDLEGIDQIPITDAGRIVRYGSSRASGSGGLWMIRSLSLRMLRSGISSIPSMSSRIGSSWNRRG